MAATSPNKQVRLNLRLSQQEKEVLIRAAELLNTTVSSFVLQRAVAEAQTLVADQTRFLLTQQQWKVFVKALDASPRDSPALRRLLTEPGVFDN